MWRSRDSTGMACTVSGRGFQSVASRQTVSSKRYRPPVPPDPRTVLRLEQVDAVRGEAPVLRSVDWNVREGERWAVLGPNGSGKTTLVQLATGYLHPTRGAVEILGRKLGTVDVRRLRERLGIVSAAVARMLVPSVTA